MLLHLAAIIFYTWRKHKLVSAMVHGDKQLYVAALNSRDDAASRAVAVVVFGVCAAFVMWVARLAA